MKTQTVEQFNCPVCICSFESKKARADHIRDIHRKLGIKARGKNKPNVSRVCNRLRGMGLKFRVTNEHGPTGTMLHIRVMVTGEPVLHIWPTTCCWRLEGVHGRFYGDFWPQVEKLARLNEILNATAPKEIEEQFPAWGKTKGAE